MDRPTSGATPRRRADAARNRRALVDAGRQVFAGQGSDVSLEAVARAAGVGIGTLYRHFPTREDLVAAVYGAELDTVLATADGLVDDARADDALRSFMLHYADFVARKRGLAEALREGALRSAAESMDTRARVNSVIGRLLAAGVEQGVLRDDVPADDVTAAMVGAFLTTRDVTDTMQTSRLIEMLVRGLRR